MINLFVRGSDGESSYNAGFLTVTKRLPKGLTFTANYTLSKTLDEYGLNQENIGVVSNPCDLTADWTKDCPPRGVGEGTASRSWDLIAAKRERARNMPFRALPWSLA